MRGNVVLTLAGILCRRYDPNELHHTAIFVRQDVTVEYVGAGEVREPVADYDPSRLVASDCQMGFDSGSASAPARRLPAALLASFVFVLS